MWSYRNRFRWRLALLLSHCFSNKGVSLHPQLCKIRGNPPNVSNNLYTPFAEGDRLLWPTKSIINRVIIPKVEWNEFTSSGKWIRITLAALSLTPFAVNRPINRVFFVKHNRQIFSTIFLALFGKTKTKLCSVYILIYIFCCELSIYFCQNCPCRMSNARRREVPMRLCSECGTVFEFYPVLLLAFGFIIWRISLFDYFEMNIVSIQNAI